MLQSLLPSSVSSFESWEEPLDGELLPEELESVSRAVPARVDEFRRGRLCAKRALSDLGASVNVIGVATRRAPRWPDGIAGSITHCEGYSAAAAACTTDISGIGIDAEPDRPLPDTVLECVASPAEKRWARSAAPTGELARDTLLFSIKEAVYKVWWPLVGTWLGFEDAEVDVDAASGTFLATIAPVRVAEAGISITALDGRFGCEGGILATAIAFSG